MRQVRQDHTFEITDPARNKSTKEGDVGITDMIVRDPPVPTIPHMIFRQQVLDINLPFGPIRRGAFGTTPPSGQLEARIRISQTRNRSVQILLRDVALMNPGDLPPVDIWERTGGFRRT